MTGGNLHLALHLWNKKSYPPSAIAKDEFDHSMLLTWKEMCLRPAFNGG